jgi:hypothetical protein
MVGWEGARMGVTSNAYGILVRKPLENHLLGRLRRRWKDNIKMDLRDNAKWLELFRIVSNGEIWY